MHKQKMIVLLLSVALLLLGTAPAMAAEKEEFKVIGYYTATSFDEPLERVQMERYTHIMYGFLKPQEDGTILPVPKPELLQQMVEKAHANDVKVFAAVGGWSYQDKPLAPTFAVMAANEESRVQFVQAMVDVVRTYDLDGVELDWEYPKQETEASYEALVLDLAEALHAMDKELSATVAGATAADESAAVSKMITPKALEALDFVEIMAYDLHTAEHSPLWFARTSTEYWLNQLPKEKVVLGVPLYARPSWVQYRHLVAANPEYAYINYVEAGPVSKLDSSYNGLPLLHDKAVYALKKAGGIMFFDVNEDADGELSAVSMVGDLVQEYGQMGKAQFEQQVWVYLNNHPLTFRAEEAMGQPRIDENGRTLLPLRKVAEAIGVDVVYYQADRSITLSGQGQTVRLVVDDLEMQVGDNVEQLDCAPKVIAGRTYVPARAVFESFGYQVQWNSYGRSVYLQKTEFPSEQRG